MVYKHKVTQKNLSAPLLPAGCAFIVVLSILIFIAAIDFALSQFVVNAYNICLVVIFILTSTPYDELLSISLANPHCRLMCTQWGYIQITEDSLYSLPIAFTKWYTGVASPDVKIGGIIGVGCSNMSKIELSTTIESYKRYIAIGL